MENRDREVVMSTDYKEVMSNFSDKKLIKIVTVDKNDYQTLAVMAAEEEIKKRNINTTRIEQVAEQEKKRRVLTKIKKKKEKERKRAGKKGSKTISQNSTCYMVDMYNCRWYCRSFKR